MGHACSSVWPAAFLLISLGILCLAPAAQAQKKESVWDRIKKAGQQGAQQGQPQQQPQQQPPNGQQPNGQRNPRGGQQAASGSAINDSAPFKPPAGTKIEEKILAPVQEGAQFEVSDHGVHVAMVGSEGSRSVVWYDGEEGPKFDEILIPVMGGDQAKVALSPDGKRYAYCARAGDQFVVMVDGKELVRSNDTQGGKCPLQGSRLAFTSNSQHVYYVAEMHELTPIDQTIHRFVFDGKPDMLAAKIDDVTFSPDGNHYAYIWNDPDRRRPWMLIVDGKPMPYQAGAPQWTNDSKHLYTQRTGSGFTELLYDGKPVARAFHFEVHIAPVGDMVVMAVTGGTNGHPVSFLVVNGKKVPGSDTVERGMIQQVVFSPDGKHYAAHCADLNVNHYLIADGKRQQEYKAIDKITYTADSSTLVYMAQVNGKTFIVANDKEYTGEGAPLQPVFSPVGNRFGGVFSYAGRISLLMDGKMTPMNARGVSDLSFTPDGQHYGYVLIDTGMGVHLAFDGTVIPQSNFNKGDIMDPENGTALSYIFSADSKHVAHFAGNETQMQRGIFLDGKFIPASQAGVNSKLVFSPDSKHVLWIHTLGDRPHRIFVDGKPLAEYYSAGNRVSTPHWLEFGPDGTLSYLAQDDNSLKRITITLSDQTSLATMLGGGTAVASSGH